MNNREIKFRVWDGELKTFYYPVENGSGRVIDSKTGKEAYRHIRMGTLSLIIGLTLTGDVYESVYGNSSLNKNLTLQQFTGLKDKNGKEIYEGDIMTGRNTPIVVGYNPPEFTFVYKNIDGGFCSNYYVGWADFEGEIIGNIMENPEILND